MERIIRLANIAHVETPAHPDYGPAEMESARLAMVRRGLSFDNATGVMRDRDGWISRFSNPSEFTPHACVEDVMRWEFRSHIANAASRVSRGFPAFEGA